MSSIVLKIPIESQSFRAALTDATLRDRVLEWTTAAVTLDDAVYIPLRTDWMPNGTRCTADGVEVLLAGRSRCRRRSRPGSSRGFQGA